MILLKFMMQIDGYIHTEYLLEEGLDTPQGVGIRQGDN